MLGMDLASLSIPDLRRVLEIARSRGQTDLADSVVAELRARAAAPAAGIAEDTAMAAGPEPGRFSAAGMRYADGWDDEDPDLGPRRRAPILILGIAAAVLVVGGAGWSLTRFGGPQAIVPASEAAAAPAVTPPGAPAAAPEVETPAAAIAGDEAPPQAAPEAPAAAKAPVIAVAMAPVATPAATTPRSPCLTRATPADRLVCGYPTLGRQHDRMLAAYNRALVMSGGDPLALDADQARWRAARDRVSDRQRLADLYQQRIRELDAIAARREPEPEPDEPDLKPKPEQPIF